MIKINLLPAYINQRKRLKVAIAVVTLLVAAEVAGFLIYRLGNPDIGTSAIGWASLIVSILVLGGFQLMTLGMLGEYVGRTHLNVNRGPQYVIRDRIAYPGRERS